MKFCANKAPSAPVRVRCSRNIARASLPAPVATCRCFPPRPNSRAALVGRVSINRLKTPSARRKTVLSECCGPKSTAAAAVAISVTSSMMARSRPGYATALTALRWCFDRQRRQRAEASPGNIANAQTTAYKGIGTSFVDLVPEATTPDRQVAGSVTAFARATISSQGTVSAAGVATYMAINGDGFFSVQKATGTVDNVPVFTGVTDYTRRG